MSSNKPYFVYLKPNFINTDHIVYVEYKSTEDGDNYIVIHLTTGDTLEHKIGNTDPLSCLEPDEN